jgi:HAD superfamily hydrolase (TIGR01509 family)
MRAGTRLLPGAAEALIAIKRAGLRTGVCSNKPVAYTRDLLDHLQIGDLCDVVLGPEDVARPKPAPDLLLRALALLRISADAALYVGDMTVDIETARQAGVPVWIVPTGSDDVPAIRAACPDRILTDLRELWLHLHRNQRTRTRPRV